MKNSQHYNRLITKLIVISGILNVAASFAEEPSSTPDNLNNTTLPEMVVESEREYEDDWENNALTTGTRAQSHERLYAVPSGTTLLDGKRIRVIANYDISDTLAYTPGLYIITGTGGFISGGSRISMRG